MGSGIGKNCQRCSEQLNYDDGFNHDETLCKKCDSIVKYDAQVRREELEELKDHVSHRTYQEPELDYDG